MSNAMYDKLWREAQALLEETTQLDSLTQSSRAWQEREEARLRLAELYVRYICVGNRLEECYDQVVQPQKRPLLRRLLDSAYGRVLELKHELVELELSEYNYYDDALVRSVRSTDYMFEKAYRLGFTLHTYYNIRYGILG